MFVALWEYEVKPGSEKRFESVYGAEGEWARMFGRDADYVETRLLRDAVRERVYVTVDWWQSGEAYEAFKEAHRKEYLAIDRIGGGLTVREKHLGSFEQTKENL